jgi:hypothetical protein
MLFKTNERRGKQMKSSGSVTISNVLASIAFCGVNQSPVNYPRKLDIVLKKMEEIIMNTFDCPFNDFYIKNFEDEESLRKWLYETLFKIPEFQEWNLSENEYKNGVSVDNENRPQFNFISRETKINKDNDFIDLDACIGNIVRMLLR